MVSHRHDTGLFAVTAQVLQRHDCEPNVRWRRYYTTIPGHIQFLESCHDNAFESATTRTPTFRYHSRRSKDRSRKNQLDQKPERVAATIFAEGPHL